MNIYKPSAELSKQSNSHKQTTMVSNPRTQPQAPTQGHLGTHHTVITVGKKGGVERWSQKSKNSTNAVKQTLKEKIKAAQHSPQHGYK